jgi:hypothetical protein
MRAPSRRGLARRARVAALITGAAFLGLIGCRTERAQPGATLWPRDPFSAVTALSLLPEEARFTFAPGPPPPRAEVQQPRPFPPPLPAGVQAPPASDLPSPPLEVELASPRGPIEDESGVTVTFNQPMVPLASLADLARHPVPLVLAPRVEGTWRWLGVRTARFERRSRFPYATRYEVQVPAGTVSASGQKLARTFSFAFETPAVQLRAGYPPERRAPVDAPIVLVFNQRVTLDRTGPGPKLEDTLAQKAIALREVPVTEWDALRARALLPPDAASSGRVVVLRPVAPLEPGREYRFFLAREALRGEGPLPTEQPVTLAFGTHLRTRFQTLSLDCAALHPASARPPEIQVSFNSRVASQDLAGKFLVTPAVKDQKVECDGHGCRILGDLRAGTTYTVSLADHLQDVHGQRLGPTKPGRCTISHAEPQLGMAGRFDPSLLEANGPRALPVRAVNVGQVTVSGTLVPPEAYLAFMRAMLVALVKLDYRRMDVTPLLPRLPGRPVTFRVPIDRTPDRVSTAAVPLAPILGRATTGLVYLELQPQALRPTKGEPVLSRRLVQVSDLAITTVADRFRTVVLVTELGTGRPVPDAEVSVYDGVDPFYTAGSSPPPQLHARAMTSTTGTVEIQGARPRTEQRHVFVRKGTDWNVLNASLVGVTSSHSGTARFPAEHRTQVHTYTDRNPYRPGDVVHLVGVVRGQNDGLGGGVVRPQGQRLTARVSLSDARDQAVLKDRDLPVNEDGVFHLELPLPRDAALGEWNLRGVVHGVGVDESPTFYRSWTVLEYRTPEFKVGVAFPGGPRFLGEPLGGEITGHYTFGSAMGGARVRWTLRRSAGQYRPPGHPEHQFGESREAAPADEEDRGEGTLDPRGRLRITAPAARWKSPAGPGTVGAFVLEAEVTDHTRQALAARQEVVVHPASVYVGMKPARGLVAAGSPAELSLLLADLEGRLVPGQAITVTAVHRTWERTRSPDGSRSGWSAVERTVGGCSARSGAAPVTCRIVLPRAGLHALRATARDARGRSTRTVLTVYAVGEGADAEVAPEPELRLTLDRARYEPGESATLVIASPFAPATALLTVERNGLQSHRVVAITRRVQVERIPITEADVPNVHVSVVVLRGRQPVPGAAADPERDPGRPLARSASVKVRVSKRTKRLQVDLSASPGMARPGAPVTVRVVVTDAAGRPAPSRVNLLAVDEGVLGLLGYRVADLVDVFHTTKLSRTESSDQRQRLIDPAVRLESAYTVVEPRSARERYESMSGDRPADMSAEGYRSRRLSRYVGVPGLGASGPDEGSGAGAAPAIVVREHFAATAFFTVDLVTDARGQGTVTFKLPDNLTTFRLTAVAVDRTRHDRFGQAEARLVVRRPLMLAPALPRFASFGDRFEAGVRVTNETGQASTVRVRLQAANAAVLGPIDQSVTLPAGGTREVRFPVAIGRPGRARFRFLAQAGAETDAVELAIPVNLPATTEAFATYGVTESSVAQTIVPPVAALTGFGGLDLSFSSTALGGLEDAVRYLVEYPWECTEQISSRVIPLFALKDLLPAFGLLGKRQGQGTTHATPLPEGLLPRGQARPSAATEQQYLTHLVTSGVAKLLAYQQPDGGFGFWQGSRESSPFASAYATFALLRAREAGQAVPERALQRATRWLRGYLTRREWTGRHDWLYGGSTRAMAAWVLSERYRAPIAAARSPEAVNLVPILDALHAQVGKLPLFARAFLLAARFRVEGRSPRVQALLGDLERAAIQDTPSSVRFREATSESLRLLLHSDRRTDAIVLATLLEVQPGHPLVEKVVRGLMEARVNGRWESTQASAFALHALSRFFKQHEQAVPDYVLRAWIGKGFVGEERFRGRSLRRVERTVPMSYLQPLGPQPLVLEKQGPGRLYYRLGLRYAPRSLKVAAAEQGFAVRRVYEAVPGEGQVTTVAPGQLKVKAGTVLRVRLTVTVPSQRHYVAVDDPLPAGFEALDLDLRTTSSLRLSHVASGGAADDCSWYTRLAFDHREKRDDRVVLFADRLPAGTYEYTYLVRATTLGSFIAPPTRAEEMYHPEVFGRAASGAVRIVP